MLQMIFSCLFSLLLGLFFYSAEGSNLNVVRQDGQRFGNIELYHQGKVVRSSNVEPFAFSWPSVEMTTNTKDKELYVIVFTDALPGPTLYLLDEHLQLKNSWENVPYWYFDLQYSNLQSTLFGVYVASTYGRVLSQFVPNQSNSSDVAVKQLFAVPYMWYVNASSFHHPTCTYYALLNYFPGLPETTLDQKIVMADFSSIENPKATVFPISKSQGIIQFIGFADATKELYFAGMVSNSSAAMVGTLDTSSGEVKQVLWTVPASAVGPLVVDDSKESLSLFTRDVNGKKWQLWSLSQKASSATKGLVASLVEDYEVNESLKVFAAASIGF